MKHLLRLGVILVAAGCGAQAPAGANAGVAGGGAGTAVTSGGTTSSGGTTVVGLGGASTAASQSGAGGSLSTVGGASNGAGGSAGLSADGGAGVGGSTSLTAGGAGSGASGAAGQGGAPTVTGVFEMCDDHADFNGLGRCAATGNVGAVFATQTLSAGAADTTLTAIFGSTSPPSDSGCTTQSAGAGCSVLSCPRTAAAITAGPAAGAISATSDGGILLTTPDANGLYDVVHLGHALWTLADTALAFAAVGGDTPAFGETFCGPPSVTVTVPADPPGATLIIDRASDLALQWTGGTKGQFEFALSDDTAAPAPTLEVRCFFDASAGQGTVPKAVLAEIGAGVHRVASYVWVRKIGIGASGTCVELTGINTNLSAAGNVPFNGAATFQ